jgi:large conductance mechanosensitive channel
VISAAITFLITAAVVYFVFVAPMNAINEVRRRKEGISEEEEEAPDIVLLTEIRDLLARRESGS